MLIKAAIFDLDGTLLDSMGIWDELDAKFLRSQGIEPRPELHEETMILTTSQFATYFRENYGVQMTQDEIVEYFMNEITKSYEEIIQLRDGAIEVLEYLAGKGIPMVVATATEESLALSALERLDVAKYFDAVLTCGNVGKPKSEPEIYFAAAKELCAKPSECLVFEDAMRAAKTAHAAGFKVALVVEDTSAEIPECADILVSDFSELYSAKICY